MTPLNLRPYDDRLKSWHRYDTATRRTPVSAGPGRTQQKRPRTSVSAGQGLFKRGTPDRIRTGATALRGQGLRTAFAQVRAGFGPCAGASWARIGHNPHHGRGPLVLNSCLGQTVPEPGLRNRSGVTVSTTTYSHLCT